MALLLCWSCLLLAATCFGVVSSVFRYRDLSSFTGLAAAVLCEIFVSHRTRAQLYGIVRPCANSLIEEASRFSGARGPSENATLRSASGEGGSEDQTNVADLGCVGAM